MKSNFLITSAVICASIIVLFIIGNRIISTGVLPSISEIGSATSTPADSNSTGTPALDQNAGPLPILSSTTIRTTKGNIRAFIADTPERMQKGLGDRLSLPPNQGMLFVFAEDSMEGFWMKDMHFAIDIIWIDKSKKVVAVNSNVAPSTYPAIFASPKPVRYVLELNAGFAKKFALATGTLIKF